MFKKNAKRDNSGKFSKLTYDYVKSYFKQNQCELISQEYKNIKSKLEYRCKCGNVTRATFDSFKSSGCCKQCGIIKQAKAQTLEYSDVKKFIEDKNCKLLSSTYSGARNKLEIQCSCGKIFKKNFNNFKSKKQYFCKECSLKNRSGSNHYEWRKDRKKYKEEKSLRDRCYKLLYIVLNNTGQKKTASTEQMLGYDYNKLYSHLKGHSNWERLKDKKWHIDHIFPIKAFLDNDIKDVKLINCLDNLRPLSAKDNILKNDKYDKEEFKNWLESKGYYI